MRDEDLAELLRSPLDDPDPPWRPAPWLVVLVAAAVLGVLLAAVWEASRTEDEAATVAPTTTIAAAPDQSSSRFPDGYTAVGEDVAMKPLAIYMNADRTVVVVNVLGVAGVSAVDNRAFPGGVWQLRDVEGKVVEDYQELRNPQALGTLAVRFPNAEAAAPRTLQLTPLAPPDEITMSVPLEFTAFPLTTGRSFDIPLAANLRLTGVVLGLDDDGGDVGWDLAGTDALARVDIVVTLPDTAGDDREATTFRSEHIAPPYPFQRQRLPRPAPSASGEDVLRRSGPAIEDVGAVTSAVMEVTVSVYRTVDNAQVEFDLGDVVPLS